MTVMDKFKLDGKVADVTSAAQGIGEALATGRKTKAYAFDVTEPENAGKLVD